MTCEYFQRAEFAKSSLARTTAVICFSLLCHYNGLSEVSQQQTQMFQRCLNIWRRFFVSVAHDDHAVPGKTALFLRRFEDRAARDERWVVEPGDLTISM